MQISGDILATFQTYLTASVGSFLPLLAAVIGTFLAFKVARLLIYTIRMTIR